MQQTDGTCTIFFFKLLFFISLYKLQFIVILSYTFTAHRSPIFRQFYLRVEAPILLEAATAP